MNSFNKKIAILRGINVGGKRKVVMSDLKLLCKKLDLRNVQTYIQSGNIIFESQESNSNLEINIEKLIEEKYGFQVPVIVISADKLEESLNSNPFYNESIDISKLHITFLKNTPEQESIEKLIFQTTLSKDKFKIKKNTIFIYCEGKYHESKLSNAFFEKILQTTATTRNMRTALKLLEISKKEVN